MIKFFRRIRKKLLDENKFSKYLIYAAGEILLVMVGILLAFQVSIWNEKNKAKALEKDLLREVQRSLIKDLNDVNENIESNQQMIASQQIMINWMESNEAFHDTLSPHLIRSLVITYFAAYQGPYETLKQIGMRKIKNDSLRNQISKLYDITYPGYLKVSNNENAVLKEHLLPKSFQYINELTFSKPMTMHNISKLRSDKEFLTIFKTLRNVSELLIYVGMIPTKKEIEVTLNMLDKELEG